MTTIKKRGRRPYSFSAEERQQVERMAGVGVAQKQICALIRDGIDEDTLVKHFSAELQRGRAKAHAKVGARLFQRCMDGDTACLIFYCKTQMGWREKQEIELGGTVNGYLVVPAKASLETDA